jgi:hypothetical protein
VIVGGSVEVMGDETSREDIMLDWDMGRADMLWLLVRLVRRWSGNLWWMAEGYGQQ